MSTRHNLAANLTPDIIRVYLFMENGWQTMDSLHSGTSIITAVLISFWVITSKRYSIASWIFVFCAKVFNTNASNTVVLYMGRCEYARMGKRKILLVAFYPYTHRLIHPYTCSFAALSFANLFNKRKSL